ncbi:FAD/NAD(P)-binding protein [Candidatus Berkiella cookevillensis]|uniref:FAD/NAD(P)-binding protein n=1 Tax=Candidatus Berkiella cookevillensis TaxID=437022 RepID=A0A0Q9YV11_9GAMM|nr:FAD/NAD(P)-binding protein [Candidatus Berkiella cookevillensis]MCS5708523.1 FAD/NAD(P)-binding protein [Candidatus Berkiella cookevillensis]
MKTKNNNFNIAIIGAGFSGSTLAIQLKKIATTAIRIALINDSSQINRGLAYSTSEQYHLLNVPAGKMSAFEDHADDFVSWLKEHENCKMGGENISEQFFPRKLYGTYLESRFTETLKDKHMPAHIESISAQAIQLCKKENQYHITLNNAETLIADKLILAIGNPKPINVLKNYGLEQHKNYLIDPWSFNQIKAIPTTAPIVIIGTGLTAIDILLSLQNQKHAGKIYLLSRHSLLPKVHEPYTPLPAQILSDHFKTPKHALAYIRHKIKSENLNWRAVVDSLRPITQNIWLQWNHDDRVKFMRHLKSFWEVHRHRIAPQVNATLQAMLSSGQAQVINAKLSAITQSTNNFKLSLNKKHDKASILIDAGYIINSTGPNYLSLYDTALFQSLVQQNLITWDPLKLGFAVDNDFQLLSTSGIASKNLFAAGPLCKALLWEITAVPDIRIQIKKLANVLIDC